MFFAARWVSGRKSTAVDRTARSVEDTGVRGSVDVTQANLYAELAAKNELLSSQILKLTGDKALLEAEISTNTEVNRVLSEKISELKELECESLGIIE